ncbi:hypothetical protein Cgig2_003794 [Carnegiea gigantea]|uniref:tRNA (guanine(37)-N1)-methyltransferase n=1 Tax=Carnegiea gigantea TaxID=171969 RepID=A0A9Q1JPC5_9CARY|nr:hypothetical protein Cgig2_003794 [Carnegiea gigantea]
MLLRCHTPSRLLFTPAIFSLHRTTSAISLLSATTQVSAHSSSVSYGPSLEKGIIPSKTHHLLTTPIGGQGAGTLESPQSDKDDQQTPFDEHQFTRVFEFAALRVPSDRCYELESRLRGHLLNWPRIRNIARVPGDEVDEQTQELLKITKGFDDEDEVVDAVNRRIYGRAEGDGEVLSGVMYRDKLAKEFNARGFVKFRNLAKISRPNSKKNKKKWKEGENEEFHGVGKGVGKRKSVVVEVLEEEENDDDLRGLLGDEFKGRKWKGSTRLLLLDERYARTNPGDLPEALKAVLNGGSGDTASISELVRCKLTLFYDYWLMDEPPSYYWRLPAHITGIPSRRIEERADKTPTTRSLTSKLKTEGGSQTARRGNRSLELKTTVVVPQAGRLFMRWNQSAHKISLKFRGPENSPATCSPAQRSPSDDRNFRPTWPPDGNGRNPMHVVLEALLPKGVIVPSAFETVGHIAHLNLRDEHLPYKKVIAKVVLDKNKPKIQTVVNKIEAISNDYRTMQLEVLSGNNSLVTTVIENGMRFQVDLATVYWNSRSATERQRLISCFTDDDVLCDVFSGVGPIAISAAKKVKRVYANDLNPYAVHYIERNCVLNKLERKIQVFNMDGRRFIDTVFSSEKGHSITQVVMNLPNNGVDFLGKAAYIMRTSVFQWDPQLVNEATLNLDIHCWAELFDEKKLASLCTNNLFLSSHITDAFQGIFRDRPRHKKFTLPMIHVYGFSKAEDPEFDLQERIRIALAESAVAVDMRRVRLVAPGKWMLCASFVLPEKVAFSKDYVDYK